ncbi:MAG TPA: hypothetical protein PLS51_01360 [Flavobacterium sp.]|jgi:hypothetical protein|nr:hypothetical protein [Flavobacterium sp.]HPJ09248.1 hypothetical protein [Flavobacterium sp.]
MNTSKIIAIVLIVAALAIAYIGINTVMANTESFNFLGMKFDVSNESGKMKGFLYIGLAVVLFGGGVYTLNKANN